MRVKMVHPRRDRPSDPPRVLFYTHDTFGMGHLRRCLNLIKALVRLRPEAAVLLVTGSPALTVLSERPRNVDVVKLPTIAPTGEAANHPAHLPLETSDIVRIRRKTIAALTAAFAPDVFMADNFPLGARRELEQTLRSLKETSTRTVLGLRDIVDAPEVVRRRWQKEGIHEAIRDLYDSVLVFGESAIFDARREYGLEPETAAKIQHCGYVARPLAQGGAEDPFAAFGLKSPRILATVGGGGDGLPLLKAFLDAMERLPDASALILAGPLQGAADRGAVARQASAMAPRVAIASFIEDPTHLMAEADLVVSMAGYNTVAELVSCGARSLLIPRNWRYGEHALGVAAGVEMEQPLRARLLTQAGLTTMLEPDELSPENLTAAIRTALAQPRAAGAALRFDGAERAAEILSALIDRRETVDAA